MNIETKCVQEGYKPKNGEPRVLPIVQSTTYKYDSTEHVGKLFDLSAAGFFYSRLANPTVAHVENKITALEGGVGSMLTSSGQAAITTAILNICSAGDHIISSSKVYGGVLNLFAVTLKKIGISVTFVDQNLSIEELQKEIKENTKLIFGETIANPALDVLDIEKFATLAHANDIPLIIDNTFATPFLCRPFEYGADIVIHSTSKYLDGHGISLGGVIVDGGKFNWANGKFPDFTTKDESYHGVIYSEAFSEQAFIVKAKVQLMRDMGFMMSPQNAFLLNVGMETLHLRMERHCSNALAIAKFLESNELVETINYPGLESNSNYNLLQKYSPMGGSGVISFKLKDGKDACVRFMDALELAAIVVHVADVRTSVLHPATSTHRQLSDKQLIDAGISSNLIRLSVGIENVDDIIEDLEKGFKNI